MNFKLAPNKLTGIPALDGWVQIHDFTPVSETALIEKGRLFAIISMQSDAKTALAEKEDLIISREILTRFHELYYNREGIPFELLNQSVAEIEKSFTSPNESLQILAAIFLNDKILIASIGKVEAWVIRNGLVSKLIDVDSKLNSVSGLLKDGDNFIFGTDSFFSKVTPDLLKSASPVPVFEKPESTLGVVSIKVTAENEEVVPQISQKIVEPIPNQISPVRVAAASFIDKILLLFPNQKIYVKEELSEPGNHNKRKIATSVGAILLLLLIVSIFLGIRQQKVITSKSKYEPILTAAEHNLDEARTLISVDQGKARNLVLTAKNDIDNLKKQNIKDPAISDLSNKISDSLGSIAGIYIEPLNMYFDLPLQSSNFIGDDIAESEDRMVVLDKKQKILLSIDIASSKADPIAGPDIMPNATHVSAYSDRNFVSSVDGIWEIGDKASKVINKNWGENILMASYAGNIYVLDKDNSAVWRFSGNGGQFDPKQNWLGAGISPNFSNITSWAFDGNVWMLNGNTEILRFAGGSPIDFTLKNSDKDPVASDIFTTQDSKYLYILDTGNSRVLVVDKDGNYKAQYLDDSIKYAKKIIVSEVDKKIILLGGDKLYSLDIKHL